MADRLSAENITWVYPEERPFWNLAKLVPSSAGFVLDTVTGDVLVAVTDLADGERATGVLRSWASVTRRLAKARVKHPRADVVAKRVDYAFVQLSTWRDRMNAAFSIHGVEWVDLDEARNRIVLGIDPGTDRGVIRRLARELGVPERAVEFDVDGPAVFQSVLTDSIRPIAGGTKIAYDSAGVGLACSLGFPALYNSGMAFLTASHCSLLEFSLDSTRQYQPRRPMTHTDSINISPIGFEVANYSPQTCPPGISGTCVWADAAVYQFSGLSSDWSLGRVARPTFGCSPGPCNPVNLQIGGYFLITSTDSAIVMNDLVSHIGIGSGWDQHFVTATCANHLVHGVVKLCQDHATYGNKDGDSGGPVLLNINAPPDSTATLGGIHWGATKKYGIFSPWSGIIMQYPSVTAH